MPSVRATTRQRSIGLAASAAFHIAILIGLAFELDKPIDIVETPPIQVTLAPPLEEPPPIPIIIPPPPKPTPVEKVTPTPAAPAAPAKTEPAPVQPAAAVSAPTPVTTPAPQKAPTVRVKAPNPVAHAAPTPAPTPIAHTSPSLIQAPMAPVLLPPAPAAAAASASPSPSAAAAEAASASPGAAGGPNGLRDALRLGFGCAHPDAVNLTAAERAACGRQAAGRGGPAFNIRPPAYIEHEGEVNEAWRRYQTSNSAHDYPGLHCAAGRDCEPDKPTPPPDPINDTCPYMRCNMGNVR
jgi:hypothetical protein